MLRFLFFALILLSLELSGRANVERFDDGQNRVFEFLADHMQTQGDVLIGKGNVVLVNLDYYATAQYARYDTQGGGIELEGDVHVFKGNSLYLKAQNVRIKLSEDHAFLEPFYLQDSSTGMWISSVEADFKEKRYAFGESILSTCNIVQPIWHLEMDEGSYDAEREWMSLWGTRLYFYRYPVFYMPYLSFSAGYKRKSGLLYPYFVHSKSDGFTYVQPVFIAPSDRWDITLSPQIRTKRGEGIFGEFRIADEYNNILWFNAGLFRNKKHYQLSEDLKNRTHLGYQLRYHRHSLLEHYFEHFNSDGIYVDFTHLNDIDYLRLQQEGENNVDIRDKLLTSRLNYYLKGEQDYLGIYVKYYIDLSKTDNRSTLQTLPNIQYHRHLTPILSDFLTYSVDYQIKNLSRRVGYKLVQQEVTIPLIYTTPLLYEYLSLSLSANLYASKANYRSIPASANSLIQNGTFYSNYYIVALSSDLARFYGETFHTIHYGASYTIPGAKEQRGEFTEVLTLPGWSDELRLDLSQYFYDRDSSLKLYHKMVQSVYFDDKNQKQKYGELENEARYHFDRHWNVASTVFYSHDERRLTEASHDLEYYEDYFNAYAGHFFRERFLRSSSGDREVLKTSFVRAGFHKEFEEFALFGNLGYDYIDHYVRTWGVGIQKEVRCFSYSLNFTNEIRPVLTSIGAIPKSDRSVMFEFRFIPVISGNFKNEY